MKIIISGHKGFIGSHLYDRLRQRKHEIVGIDKKDGVSTSSIDDLKKLLDTLGKVDIFVHLGANCSSQISLRDPTTDFIDNAVGTFNVCEASRTHGNFPIIFNSTMKVYPGEDGVTAPYGVSKLVGEQYLLLYNRVYGTSYVINRPSSVYGPRQNGSDDGGWFTWFIKASLQNKKINLYGSGTQSRDVLYIDDCVDILVDQVENFEKYKNEDFDFGGGIKNEVSLNELLDELNYHNTTTKPKLKGDIQRFVCDNKKIHKLTGWKPRVGWRKGLKKTIEHLSPTAKP